MSSFFKKHSFGVAIISTLFAITIGSTFGLIPVNANPAYGFTFNVTRIVTKDNTPTLGGTITEGTVEFNSEDTTFPITIGTQTVYASLEGSFTDHTRPWSYQVTTPLSDGNYNVVGGTQYSVTYHNISSSTDVTIDSIVPEINLVEPSVPANPQIFTPTITDTLSGTDTESYAYGFVDEICDSTSTLSNFFTSGQSISITDTTLQGKHVCFGYSDLVGNRGYYISTKAIDFGTPTQIVVAFTNDSMKLSNPASLAFSGVVNRIPTSLTVTINEQTYSTITFDGNNWSLDNPPKNLTDGNYTATVIAYDSLHEQSASDTMDVSIDSQAPVVTFTNPVNQDINTKDTITVTLDDLNLNDPQSITYGFSTSQNCTEDLVGTTTTTSDFTFDVTTSTHNGDYVCVYASDSFENGAWTSSENPLNVHPIIFSVEDDVDAGPTRVDHILVSSDVVGMEGIRVSGHLIQDCDSSTLFGGGNADSGLIIIGMDYPIDFEGLNGLYLCYYALDGNQNILQRQISAHPFNIDSTAPNVTINEQTTEDTTPLITGTYEQTEDLQSLVLNIDNQTINVEYANGEWNAVPSALAPGSYEATITSTDLLGNQKTETTTILITTPTPTGDEDGIDANIEDAAPNNGDGNGDNILDSEQNNVSSFVSTDGHTYITLVAQDQNGEACSIKNVTVKNEDDFDIRDTNYDFVYGVTGFEAECSQANITVFWSTNLPQNMRVYRKFVPLVPGGIGANAWVTFPATFTDITVGGQAATKAIFTLYDGQLGDSTGIDGKIVDPGGVGLLVTPTQSIPLPKTGGLVTPRTGGVDAMTYISTFIVIELIFGLVVAIRQVVRKNEQS